VPGLLDQPQLDHAHARRQLDDLRSRARHLGWFGAALGLAGAVLVGLGQSRPGVPLLIGTAAALGLLGLCRTDRRRLLVRLVAQGDAWALDGVRELARELCTPRERRRLAGGLKAAAEAGRTGAQLSMMVDAARAGDAGDRLLALADRFGDPLVAVSAQAAAICRRLLCDARHSPLYNPHVPERDLSRVLDLLEGDLRPGPLGAQSAPRSLPRTARP
jgi:hypothetical protein